MRIHLATESTTSALLEPPLEVDGADITVGELHESVDVLVHGTPTAEQLAHVTGALVVPYAGLAARTARLLLAARPELPVYNLHHNASSTAEHAIALLLAVARTLLPVDRRLRTGDWRPRYAATGQIRLAGHRVVVLGRGQIGSRVSRTLRALGMDAIEIGRSNVGELDEALRGSRALVSSLPLTPATRGLIDARRLRLLDRHGIVVNVGRGPVFVEEELYEVLAAEELHGAGLDVWYRYPKDESGRTATPPSKLDFGALDNVVMTPHLGGHGDGIEPARRDALVEVLGALAAGREPDCRVDVEAGY